jgi:hypothetical protein
MSGSEYLLWSYGQFEKMTFFSTGPPMPEVVREGFGWVKYNSINNSILNLIPQLLVFLTNCSPTVKSGCRNGNRRRQALYNTNRLKTYEY